MELRKRENFRQGILRMTDALHDNSARLIVAGSRQHASIHELRVNIKKIRGILRLIRDEIGREKYRELNEYYSSIAGQIAVLRDSTSQIELIQGMQKKINAPDTKRTLSTAARQVEKKRKSEIKTFNAAGRQQVIQQLILDGKEKIHALDFHGDPDSFILKSLNRVHRRASSAHEVTGFLKNDGIYHYYRKQVKYLMYQLTILSNAWPSYLSIYITELTRLGNLLGKLHDLNLFNEHIHEKKLIDLNRKQKPETLKFIYSRRAALKKKIEKTGDRLFNESSDAFAFRIYDIWINSVFNTPEHRLQGDETSS